MERKPKSAEVLRTLHLAELLEADIKARGLKEGDTYFSTQGAAEFLGVARIYANNALQLLEKKSILLRRQKMGAIIASPKKKKTGNIDRVHFLVPEYYFRCEGAGSEELLLGLQQELTGASIGYCFVTPENEAEMTAKWLEETAGRGGCEAFILVAASWRSQHLVEKSGFPALIHGSPYHGINRVPFIERDHRNGIHQVLDYLKSRNRKHWGVLLRERIHPGDCIMLEALRFQKGFDKYSPLLFTTPEEEQIAGEVRFSLQGKNPPDAFICVSIPQANGVRQAIEDCGLVPYQDVDIIMLNGYGRKEERAFTHLRIEMPPLTLGHHLGHALFDLAAGHEVANELLPVRLVPYKEKGRKNS